MGQLYDRATDSATGLSAGGALGPVEVKTAGTADGVTIAVDDDAGSAAASYSLEIEVYDEPLDTWFTYENVSASTNPSYTTDAVGDKVRVTLTNESGAADDFRVLARSHK